MVLWRNYVGKSRFCKYSEASVGLVHSINLVAFSLYFVVADSSISDAVSVSVFLEHEVPKPMTCSFERACI